MKSAPFFFSFACGVLQHVLRLGGEADDEIRALLVMADAGEDVGVLDHLQRRRTFAGDLLDLLAGGIGRAPVGDGGDEDRGVGGQKLLDRVAHFFGALDMDGLHAGGIGDQSTGPETRRTSAPSRASAAAMAWPCLPDERLAM